MVTRPRATCFIPGASSTSARGNATLVQTAFVFPVQQLSTSTTQLLALIIEDTSEATDILQENGYLCKRITHSEVLSSAGTGCEGTLNAGQYSMLWISTPSDYSVRIPTTKKTPHWQKVCSWLQKACLLGLLVVIFGQPGFLWNMPEVQEVIRDHSFTTVRMRLCHFGDRYDSQGTQPSGSYLQVATTRKISNKQWQCPCKMPIQHHKLDWYGNTPAHAAWRRTISARYVKEICRVLKIRSASTHIITDAMTSPLPILDSQDTMAPPLHDIYPTDARVKQKERLKLMKEQGLKPKKKPKVIEPGNDDCGDDISGLGKDVILLSCDLGTDPDEDDALFVTLPSQPQENSGSLPSLVAYLCYGRNNRVDLLELCGGEGRISTVAFKRRLTSGGNLDLVTGCDLGDPKTQTAINHYLRTCHVMVVILQPNCRSTGRNSYYNAVMNRDTWLQHHEEDLPHIQYCGKVAL